MADDETTGGEEDLWASAAEDLEKQREMLRDNAATAEDTATAEAPPEPEPASDTVAVAQRHLNPDQNVEMILDIPLHLSVELGRARMLINDLLQLGQGSVIELTKLVGEPLDILINDKLVAKGEVVVVNEKFGVRLSDIISTKERIENLG